MTFIFDWDGTIHNTKIVYGKAVKKAYQYLVDKGLAQKKSLKDEEISKYLGINAPDMWEDIRPGLPQEEVEVVTQLVNDVMRDEISAGHSRLYNNILEVLEYLKEQGNDLVFLSNCTHDYLVVNREHFNLDKYFSKLYCCEDFDNIPKYEIFDKVKEELVEPIIVVGDRAKDLEIAKIHDLISIGCEYGFGDKEELSEATYKIDDPLEIIDIYKKIEGNNA